MNLKKLIFVCIVCYSSSRPSIAQAQSNLTFETISVKEGLSQHNIQAILRDKSGFLWIGTWDGLNRYDGQQFKVYKHDPQNPKTLSSKWILALAEGEDGILWVGTIRGLNRFNTRTQEAEQFIYDSTKPGGISSNDCKSLCVDHNGLVWAGTLNGLNVFNYHTKKFQHFYHDPKNPNSLSDNDIHAIWEDKKGNMWLGTANGLNYYNRITNRFTHYTHQPGDLNSLSENNVQGIFEDRLGIIWIGTDSGLNQFDSASQKFKRYQTIPTDKNTLSGNTVYEIMEDDDGLLWITTNNGLNILDRRTSKFTHYHPAAGDPKSLGSDYLDKIYKDNEGIIWIGGDGLYKHNPRWKLFEHYYHKPSDKNSLGNNYVQAIQEDMDGILWVGTAEGLNRFDRINNKWTIFRHQPGNSNSLTDDKAWSLLIGSTGKIWIATASGLDCLDTRLEKFTHYYHKENDSSSLGGPGPVQDIIEDRNGNIWASVWGGGLNRLDIKTGKFRRFIHNPNDTNSLTSNTPWGLVETNDGHIWINIVNSSTIDRYDPEKDRFMHYKTNTDDPAGIHNRDFTVMRQDHKGKLWIGGLMGVDCLDPLTGKVTHYREKDGLPNEVVWGFTEDKSGHMWLSTNRGITRFDPETHRFKNFDVTDGLQDYEFSFAGAQSKRTGEMFFGGKNGFNIFNPDSIMDLTYRPTVIITTLRRFNKDNVSGVPIEQNLLAEDSISLSYQDNMLNIEFVSLSLSKPQKNQFAYRLIGLNDQWYQLGTKREISLTGLSPGKYILEVKGSNGDGVWNENPDTLHITILPPWWRTWWAYALYAIIFITAVFAFIRYRSRNLKAQNIRLEQKVAIRTSELKQSLDNLKSTQAQLIQSEKMASLGELTAGIAHEIQNPLNFVNNFSEVNTELIGELEQEANKGNLNEVKIIVKDIKENEQKITHHGKRADSIVKNMLQHSRVGAGHKEPTNINGLADEYLKLAYHGMRAKDKSFNATLQTDFDSSIGKINIVPQEIGRVLLNLYNNGFYALNEKQKQNIPGYEPTISLSTKKIGDKISINVKDNGSGISQNVLDKIFQPFFTTKPTAQGTGLGLSLAYDIVKSHGGEIKVVTEEGEGSTFVVELPAL